MTAIGAQWDMLTSASPPLMQRFEETCSGSTQNIQLAQSLFFIRRLNVQNRFTEQVFANFIKLTSITDTEIVGVQITAYGYLHCCLKPETTNSKPNKEVTDIN